MQSIYTINVFDKLQERGYVGSSEMCEILENSDVFIYQLNAARGSKGDQLIDKKHVILRGSRF